MKQSGPAHPRCPCQQEGEGGRTLALAVNLRDPMGNRFDSNMTQEVSGREGQLGPAPGIPPAPVEAWPTQTLCSALPHSSGGHHPGGTCVIGQEGPACHLALGTLAPPLPPWTAGVQPSSLSSQRLVTGLRPVPPSLAKTQGACATSLRSGRAGAGSWACSWWVRK